MAARSHFDLRSAHAQPLTSDRPPPGLALAPFEPSGHVVDAAPPARRIPGAAPAVLTALVAGVALAILWVASAPTLLAAAGAVDWLAARNGPTGRAIVTVAVVLGAALALVLRWSHATSPSRAVRLAGGRGTISVVDMARALEARWLEIPEVVSARAAVENRHRRGVRVAARVAVTEHARVDEVLTGVVEATARIVTGQLGVDLATQPRVELRYRALDVRAGPAHDFRAPRAGRPEGGDGDAAG